MTGAERWAVSVRHDSIGESALLEDPLVEMEGHFEVDHLTGKKYIHIKHQKFKSVEEITKNSWN